MIGTNSSVAYDDRDHQAEIGISLALLKLIQRLCQLNTIREISNLDFEINQPTHPLVQKLNKTVHVASDAKIFTESLLKNLEKMFDNRFKKSSSRNSRLYAEPLTQTSTGDAWLISVLVYSPSLLPLESRYKLFSKFSEYYQPHINAIRQTMNGDRKFKIRRTHLYEDALEQMTKSNLVSNFAVTFVDRFGNVEKAAGSGVDNEFLNLFIYEAFSADKKLFVESVHSNKLFPSMDSAKYVVDSSEKYYLIGKLIGSCILKGMQISVPIAKFVLKEILYGGSGKTRSSDTTSSYLSDLMELDEDLFAQLMQLRDADPHDVENYELNFTYTASDGKTVNLIEDGNNIKVTKSNRLFYIEKVAKLKLFYGIERQLDSLRNGFMTIVPLHWLQLFNSNEVEYLLYGVNANKIDISDWKNNTLYDGFEINVEEMIDGEKKITKTISCEENPVIKNFWSILENDFQQKDLTALLKFATSLHRPPLLGFNYMQPKFRISNMSERARPGMMAAADEVDILRDSSERKAKNGPPLPRGTTCFHTLSIPYVEDRAELKRLLLMAIYETEGFAFG